MNDKVVNTRKVAEAGYVVGLLKDRKEEKLRRVNKKRKKQFGDDSSDISFSEEQSNNFEAAESYYEFVSTAIENTPDVRPSVVRALKEIQKKGRNINDIYPAKQLADKQSLRKMLFINSNVTSAIETAEEKETA
ncbi:MAG: hypothetical protein MK033_11180 [Candidatus Caenarcaniphilales bacterium]|nr:hypothetical protein [Candidatus Caenarcaniphilales bacterium]